MPDQPLQFLDRRRPGGWREPVIQTCERCGLVLTHRAAWMQMTFCPRCVSQWHVVELAWLREEDVPQRPSPEPVEGGYR